MFDIFFGWRKASKCKKLIKRVQCRLKLLKNKRYSIVKQLREDLAQLIKLGYHETAFNRAEQLLKDESIMSVYDMLDNFSEFVNIQLSYIRRHKDCPNDINEAVSSLIFASARCADLPELPAIRKLFGERYGQRFATAAVELLPGNLVNREIKEKLSIKSFSDDVKYKLINEIARDCCLQPEILALEYIPEMKRQTSDGSGMEGKSILLDPLAMSISQCHSYSYPNSDAISASASSSQRHSLDKMKIESSYQIKAEKLRNLPQTDSPGDGQSQSISWICTNSLKQKNDERIKVPSSSESSPQFSEEVVVYLDDIEELKSSLRKGDCQDQRLFKFQSPILPPKREVFVDGSDDYDESCTDQEVQDETWSSKTFSKISRNSIGNKLRQRSFSLEPSSMKDADHKIYYEKPFTSSPNHKHKSHHYRKLQKMKTVAESKESTYVLKRLKQPCCNALGDFIQANNFKYNTTRSYRTCFFNGEENTCSLENPCYNCTFDDREEKFPPRNQKRGLRKSGQFPIFDAEENLDDKFCHCQCSSNGAPNDETGCITVKESTLTPNPRRRSYDNGASVYELFTLPKMQKAKAIGKVKGSDSAGSHVSCNSSIPSTAATSQMRKETVAPYMRAMTMPQERPREVHRYSVLRSNPLFINNPNHVHPHLPEYDDIAAKFMALKKEHLLHKLSVDEATNKGIGI